MLIRANPEESATKGMNSVSLVGSLRPPYHFGGANAKVSDINYAFSDDSDVRLINLYDQLCLTCN